MRKIITEDRIEIFDHIPGWTGETSIIVFSTIQGRWHTASSMAFPSKLNQAETVMNAYIAGFDELNKKLNPLRLDTNDGKE